MFRNLKIIFSLITFSWSSLAFAQDGNMPNPAKNFIVVYSLGSSWDKDKPAHEQKYFNEHSAHLSALRKSGQIELGGRYGELGMIILKVKDEAEAESLIMNDVAIKNKLFKAEIKEFNTFYKGCVK